MGTMLGLDKGPTSANGFVLGPEKVFFAAVGGRGAGLGLGLGLLLFVAFIIGRE